MKRKEYSLTITWKLFIIITFIISLCSIFGFVWIEINNNVYETKIIELDNNNHIEYANVVDYICDEGIEVSNFQLFGDKMFYASAWKDADVHKGKCMIKIKIS